MISIDIILPYYNGAAFIEEQIGSILKSEISGIEIRFIIINDASTVKDTQHLNRILPSNHLYFENEKNLGVIKSVERGLMASTANFIMLCDQDDVWLKDKISLSLSKIKDIGEPMLVYTDLSVVDKNLNSIYSSMANHYGYKVQNLNPGILFQNIVTGCTLIFNRSLLNLVLPFPHDIPMHDHWIAACAVFFGKIEFLPQSTVMYRQHASNQIGATNSFNISIKKFKLQLKYKINLIHELSERLERFHQNETALYLKRIEGALRRRSMRDIYDLCKFKVINGNIFRKFIKCVYLYASKIS